MKNKMKIFIALCIAVLSFVNVNAQTLSFTSSPSTVYVGDEVTFTNTSTGFANTVRWVWNYGDLCVLPNAVNNTPEACNDTVIYDSTITRHTYEMNGFREVVLIALSSLGEQLDRIALYVFVDRNTSVTCVTNFCNYIANSDFAQDAPWANIPNACTGPSAHVTPGLEPTAPIFNFQFLSCWDAIGFPGYYYFCGNSALQVAHPQFWTFLNRDGCQWGDYHYQITNPRDPYVGLGTLDRDENNQLPSTDWEPIRHYLHQALPTALPGGQHNLRISVSWAERSGWASNGLQALLTNCPLTPPVAPNYLPGCPCAYTLIDIFGSSVMTNSNDNPWQRYDIPFSSSNSYSHIYIGNFKMNPGDGNSTYGNLTETVFSGPHFNGCSWFGDCQASDEAFYYIDQVEIVTPIALNVTATPNPVCLTNPLTPVTLSVMANFQIVSVQWTPSAGLTCPTCATTIATPSANTTYTVTVTTICGTATGSVTVSVYPSPVITVPNATICNGQSTVLTASGASTYTWSPGTTLSATTGSSVTANPTSTITYTVTGTDANGCTATTHVTVTVNPIPVVGVSPNVTICSGQPTVLTASGANTYTWSPATGLSNTTGTSVSANPAITTTYIVTGTDANGCTGTTSVTVTVIPAAAIPIITGPHNNCINLSGSSIYTIQNHTDYTAFSSWTSSSNLIGEVITNPNNPWEAYVDYANSSITSNDPAPQICVTVTASNGCQRTECIPIFECCNTCGASADLTIDNLYAHEIFTTYATQYSSIIAGPDVLDLHPNGTEIHVVINGDFIVDMPNLTIINGKSLCMGPEAKITIQPGNHLYMGSGGNNPDATILHSGCNIMWDGIYISDNQTQLSTVGMTILSPPLTFNDARNAVVSVNGGVYQMDETNFDVNNKGIVVQPYSNTHLGFVIHSNFSSNTTPLLNYYQGVDLQLGLARTNIGIDINSVGGITIGDASSTNTNTFNNMDVGIWSKQSILSAWNNSFTNIHQINLCPGGFPTPPPCAPEGYCILAQANLRNVSPPYLPAVNVGTTSSLSNEFDDSGYGVFVDGEHNVDIGFNDFDDVKNGIHVQHNFGGSPISVYHNTMDKFNSGVRMLNNARATISISNNDFNATNTVLTPASYGIDVQEALLSVSSSPIVTISSNIIKHVTTGITTTNLYGAGISGTNDIFFEQNHPTWQSYGIRIKNNLKTNVWQNQIFRATLNISTNIPPAPAYFAGTGYIGRLYGISMETSYFCDVYDNHMGHLGGGIRCFSMLVPNKFSCNQMGYCQRGFTLEFAFPGQQGSSGSTQDNAWLRDVGFSGLYPGALDVFGNNSPTGQDWYVQNINNPIPLTPTRVSPPTLLDLFNGSANTLCSALPPAASKDALQQALVKIIQNTRAPNCPLNTQGIFLSQLSVYIELMNDPQLLSLGTSDDAYLQAFFDSATVTNIGEIANTKFLMGEEDYSNAENKNSSIAPEDQSQQNEKLVNEVYLATWAKDIYALTQEQYEALYEIAQQNPLTGGPAVYTARVMLGLDFYDEVSEERLALSNEGSAVKYLHVYPNPANNEVTVDYSIEGDKGFVYLIDVTGREIMKQPLFEGTSSITISTTAVSSGIYYLRLMEGDQVVGNEKLVILK
jgi:hypothetical protein